MKIEDKDIIKCMRALKSKGIVGDTKDGMHAINEHVVGLYFYTRAINLRGKDDALSCELGMLKHLLCLKYFVNSDQHEVYEFQPTGTLDSVVKGNYDDPIEYKTALHSKVVEFLTTVDSYHVSSTGAAMLNSLIYSVWITLTTKYPSDILLRCICGNIKTNE